MQRISTKVLDNASTCKQFEGGLLATIITSPGSALHELGYWGHAWNISGLLKLALQ